MDRKLIGFILLIVIVVSAFLYIGITNDNNVEYNITYDSDSSSNNITNNYTYNAEYNSVIINGTITGSNNGLEPVVDSYSTKNNELNVTIGFESKNKISNPVITTYDYRLEFKNIDVDKVTIKYNDNISE